MKNSFLFVILFVFGFVFLAGCSMMPDDEEIIKGSILENEIFGEEFVDEISNDENLIDDEAENIQNDVSVENTEDDEGGDTEIQVEVAE